MDRQKYWTHLDAIAPAIRAKVVKIKYGSATERELVELLRTTANTLEKRIVHEEWVRSQLEMPLDDSPPHAPI